MTDPQLPVDRGLRATVQMAAGINIGTDHDTASVLSDLRERLSDAHPLARLAAIGRHLPHFDRTALMRHVSFGAAIGAAIVGLGFAGLAAQAALTAPGQNEVALHLLETAVKGDRLAVGMKLASLGTPSAVAAAIADVAVTERDEIAGVSTVAPILAYASLDAAVPAANAIDRVLDAPPAPGEELQPAIVEDGDDDRLVPIAIPMPRVRPQIEQASLPMPKPKPRILAALDPLRITSDAPSEEAVETPRRAEPAARPSSNALGFFSSPTEPVRPPSKTTIDTPFGVPYVLQTGSVETACLKPELVDVLRKVEAHYGQKVVITSGFRDRGRQGSLHRQCAAADIEIPGVPATALAAYARTIPAIGGVGTYCHPHMIHVDTGTPRDWKYGCGSFFAMRGAPGKWGKVPPAMAKAQSTGAPNLVASDASEED